MFLFKRISPHGLRESAEKKSIRCNKKKSDLYRFAGRRWFNLWNKVGPCTHIQKSAATFESFNFKNSQTKTLSHF